MTYEEFRVAFGQARDEAKRLYSAEAKGTVLAINGMDDTCLSFIFSDDFVEKGAEAAAAQAVREVEEDFATA